MIIQTTLEIKHKELIKIFIKANELYGVYVVEHPFDVRGRLHMGLRLESTREDSIETLTFMGLRHCGIQNMLDDYLLKCGVLVYDLNPKSIGRQEQEEREEKINNQFLTELTKIKEKNRADLD